MGLFDKRVLAVLKEQKPFYTNYLIRPRALKAATENDNWIGPAYI
jgi:hypothetical protein